MTAGAAVATLVLALRFGGGAPAAAKAGVPDAGAAVGWGLPLARLLADVAGTAVVGCLLAAAALVPASRGRLRTPALHLCGVAAAAAAAWSALALTQLVLTYADFLAQPARDSIDPGRLLFFAQTTVQGRALLAQALLAAFVALLGRLLATTHAVSAGLLVSLAALGAPALAGHSTSAGNHTLAVASLLVHLVAAALWVGGLGGLLLIGRRAPAELPTAAARFSALAAWCFTAVALSGVVNAVVRVGAASAVIDSGYGRLVLGKTAALVLLGVAGWVHRRRTLPLLAGAGRPAAFRRIAARELSIMAITFGLAVALSRTPPPVPENLDGITASAARTLLGYELPPAPTPGRLLLAVQPDGFALTAVVLAAALYVAGLRALHRRGDRWPPGRSTAWALGLVVIVLATSSGLGRYAQILFSAHMAQHMILGMLAPILLVLGAPVTLALRTLPTHGELRATLLRVLHSRPTRVLAHPLVAAAIFAGGPYVVYFTPLLGALLRSHWGHLAMQVHFLLAGYLFFWVLIGIDPGPRRPPYAARLVFLLLAMAVHAFFGVALMSTATVLGGDWYAALERAWSADLLADQRLGGGIAWGVGELPVLLALAALVPQWIRDDERAARRADSHGEAELAAYNDRLARLSARERTRD